MKDNVSSGMGYKLKLYWTWNLGGFEFVKSILWHGASSEVQSESADRLAGVAAVFWEDGS